MFDPVVGGNQRHNCVGMLSSMVPGHGRPASQAPRALGCASGLALLGGKVTSTMEPFEVRRLIAQIFTIGRIA